MENRETLVPRQSLDAHFIKAHIRVTAGDTIAMPPVPAVWNFFRNIANRVSEYAPASDFEDLPPDAIDAAKAAIMDCLARMLGGSGESLSDILCRYVAAESTSHAASVVGLVLRTSAANTALINGAMGHALDYDDITQVTKTHPTTVLPPAALAVAEEAGASGKDLLLDYLTGFEIACAIGETLTEAYYDDLGWYSAGPLGAVGAAVAASKIMAFDPEHTGMAFSQAADVFPETQPSRQGERYVAC